MEEFVVALNRFVNLVNSLEWPEEFPWMWTRSSVSACSVRSGASENASDGKTANDAVCTCGLRASTRRTFTVFPKSIHVDSLMTTNLN